MSFNPFIPTARAVGYDLPRLRRSPVTTGRMLNKQSVWATGPLFLTLANGRRMELITASATDIAEP